MKITSLAKTQEVVTSPNSRLLRTNFSEFTYIVFYLVMS